MHARLHSMMLAALVAISAPVAAQQPTQSSDTVATADSTAAVPTAAPALAVIAPAAVAVPAGVVRRQAAMPTQPIAGFQSRMGLGQSRAMMIVGLGGLVAGAIIGGDVGTIFMVGGAVIGLYGLYKYLQ